MQQSTELSLSELKKTLQRVESSERATILNAVDGKGNTLLHTAVDAENLELVSYLLGLDVRMNVTNAAEEMPVDIARKKDNKKIATLLTTRMDWVDRNSSGISLNRALELIQDSYHSIEKGRDKNLVLILGETGVGKSTLINYLNGVEYKEVGTRGFDCHTECVTGKEIAAVGHSTAVSETLYPQVLEICSEQGVLDVADLAGLNGTRESVVELAGTLSTHLLSKMAQAIKSILFVIDTNSLSASRGGPFRQTIKTLNKILQGNFNSKASASVHFVITKLPPGVTTQQVVSRYIKPLHEQLERLISQDGLSEDDQAMYHTIELMLQFPERIFIPNVFDGGVKGSSREQILSALNKSPVISKDGLDFLHMDKHQEAFLALLTFLSYQSGLSSCKQRLSLMRNRTRNGKLKLLMLDKYKKKV
jgi:energy-coupling factor transporter ATP-binding protein EcfA2